MLPLETLPSGDPSGGDDYLWNVLPPEESSRMWVFLNMNVLQEGVVSTSPNPQAGGPPLVGYPRLLIQFISSYPQYRRPFLHPQPEDAPCRGDRDPLHGICALLYNILYTNNNINSSMRMVVCSSLQVAGRVSWRAASAHLVKLLWRILAVTERAANVQRLLKALYILT